MTFGLGVDLGTSFTAAAVLRDGRPEMVDLGDRSAVIPSVVAVRPDGTTLIGEAADRRAATEPSRVARQVKRRLGDPTPLVVGGEPYSAAQLLARLLERVVDAVVERQGGGPDALVLTHPANWGPYKRETFSSVPRLADLAVTTLISEPEAAAVHYASSARVAEGALVGVYDLGGGTFDATVLRKVRNGFEFLGPPEGVEGLGGIDFDEAVFAHVDDCLDGALGALDLDDPQDAAALLRVRRECVLAKEALSADTETTISVLLPDRHTDLRLTRAELEERIRTPIEATTAALRRALGSANVEAEELSTLLLIGGSSRVPLVARMLSAELGRPTAVDAHPKHAVALGAALVAGARRLPLRAETRTGPPQARSAPGRSDRGRDGGTTPTPRAVPPPTAGGLEAATTAITPGTAGDRPARGGPREVVPGGPEPVPVRDGGTRPPPAGPPRQETSNPVVHAAGSPPPSLRRPHGAGPVRPDRRSEPGRSGSPSRSEGDPRRRRRLVLVWVAVVLVLAFLAYVIVVSLADDRGLGSRPPASSAPCASTWCLEG